MLGRPGILGLARALAGVLCLCAVLLLFPSTSGAKEQNANGRTWNVAFVEGGLFVEFRDALMATVKALSSMGLVDADMLFFEDGGEDMFWDKLSALPQGRLHFLKDGFYSSQWNAERHRKTTEEVKRRIREKGDIDLIISMGGWASRDLVKEDIGVPMVVMCCSDALSSGIVKGAEYSGRVNVHAETEQNRLGRMFSFFHGIFPVARVGVAFDNSPEGRRLSGIDWIHEAARTLQVEIIESHAPFLKTDAKENARLLRGCVEELVAKGAQSIFFLSTGTIPGMMPYVMEPLKGKGIPTFTPLGKTYVQNGVLMCLTNGDYTALGRFEAEVIKAILDGRKPGEISQVFGSKSGIAINMHSAMEVGWIPPLELLVFVDTVYKSVQKSPTTESFR